MNVQDAALKPSLAWRLFRMEIWVGDDAFVTRSTLEVVSSYLPHRPPPTPTPPCTLYKNSVPVNN